MSIRHRTTAAVLVWLMTAGAAAADPPSREFWPEIDTWLRLSPVGRVSVLVPLAENLDTHYREGNLIVQGDYAWGTSKRSTRLFDEDRARAMRIWMLRGGYLGGKSLDDQGEAYTEYTTFGELHVRLPLKGGFLMSHRLRTDLRWLGKDSHELSNRLRYRAMLERDYTAGRASIVPYVSVEPSYDSRYDTVNRVRLIMGTSVGWWPRAAVEANLTYQRDSKSSTKEVHALNLILHVFFDASHKS